MDGTLFMDEIELIEYKKIDLSNSMVIVAFPTVGLVSSIAGHFIVDNLKLNEIGAVVSRYFMPTTVIHNSIASPPVRIYAGEKKCGPDGSCEQIVVIMSEFMPPYEMIQPLVEKIMSWAEKKGCKTLVSLEGIHAQDEEKKVSNVYGIGSNKKMRGVLKKYDIEEMDEAMITGVTGVLLYMGVLKKRDVICLLSEAHLAYPDSRAAGKLLEKLNVMLPAIKIDPEPLYKQAERIEKNIKKFLEQSKPTAPSMPPTPQMYG